MTSNFYDLYLKDSRSNPFKNFALRGLNAFLSINQVAEKITFFDEQIANKGLNNAALKLLGAFKVRVNSVGLGKLENQNAYLIYGNHPTFLDPLLILTALGLDEIKLFASVVVLKIGPNFSRHVFPIKNLQTAAGKRRKQHLWDDWLFKIFPSMAEYCDREKAIIDNLKQVEKAADFLAEGGKFLIFPFGHGKSPDRKNWKKGIGFILNKALKRRKCPKIKLLPFFIEEVHPYLFHFKVLFRVRRVKTLNIYFGKEIEPSKFGDLVSDPKKLTDKISKEYRKFVRALK